MNDLKFSHSKERLFCAVSVGTGNELLSGNIIDFYLSSKRNATAAKRFLGKALRGLGGWENPKFFNTDKASFYGAEIRILKAEGKCHPDMKHGQVKYLIMKLKLIMESCCE